MNTNEMRLISELSDQLKSMNISSSEKDVDADKAIQATIASLPDAIYKLVQVALVQHLALEQLRNQVAQLKTSMQSQAQSPQPSKGFLDDLKEKFLGRSSTNSNIGTTAVPQQSPPSMMASPQTSHSSGFLGQAMTVGAGVAGGMLLGNAIESLFTHHASSSAFNSQPSEVVENNYFGSDFTNNNLPDPSQDDLTINDQSDSSDFSGADDFSNFDDGGSDW